MNQDAFAFSFGEVSTEPHFFVVADGMGAHAAGELASQMAVDEVQKHFRRDASMPMNAALRGALERANHAIYDRGQQDTQLYNMGTTCSVLALAASGAWVAHVGDSRVYRCRQGTIEQLTFDHSLVWEMRAAGQLGRSDHDSGIPRNVITRCLGPHAEVEVDLEGPFSIQRGDVFLLCSDGLTGRVTDQEIGLVAEQLDPPAAAQLLVDLANLRGGADNVTVLIAAAEPEAGEVPVAGEQITAGRAGTHAGWWLGAAVGLVALLLSWAVGRPEGMIGGSIFALVCALGAGLQWLRQQDTEEVPRRAPYVSTSAALDDSVHAGIVSTLDEVCDSMDSVDAGLRGELKELAGMELGEPRSVCERWATLARRVVDLWRTP